MAARDRHFVFIPRWRVMCLVEMFVLKITNKSEASLVHCVALRRVVVPDQHIL